MSHTTRGETEELERLASQLTLSETPKQVCTTKFQSIPPVPIQQLDKPLVELGGCGKTLFNLNATFNRLSY